MPLGSRVRGINNIPQYEIPTGNFFIYKEHKNFFDLYHCRDLFGHIFSKGTRAVGFTLGLGTKNLSVNDVVRFFTEIESKLCPNQLSVIRPTDHSRTIIIEVSPFWRLNQTRRSLFTLLLRASVLYYNGKSIDSIFRKYYLARECKDAIKHFLDGNTKLTKEGSQLVSLRNHHGFFIAYRDIIAHELPNYLTKP